MTTGAESAARPAEASDPAQPARARWMGLLARAEAGLLARLWAALGEEPPHRWLRRPEPGTVMLRARSGGTGAPFNLGEVTVTRASVRLDCGAIGHAWVQGHDADKARIAAIADALMQTDRAAAVRTAVIAPLEAAEAARAAARAAKAKGTEVQFFTLVRGDG